MTEGVQDPGFLLIDKESGWTSHDVVAKIRGRVGGKVGHAGTLDPMATGLLVLALGSATRLLRFVQGARKVYVATAMFGVATDSLDADGAVLSRDPLPVTAERIETAMERFRGEIMQVPPMVSARKVEGKRLYALAREGKVVEREARPVTIHSLELVDIAPSDYPEVTFSVECSTGTYVRTLADDLARALGGRAHLTSLRRTSNGTLQVDDAVGVGKAIDIMDAGRGNEILIKPQDALGDLPTIAVDDVVAFRVRNGRPLESEHLIVEPAGDLMTVTDKDDRLMAVYRRDAQQWRPEVVLS